MRAPPVILCVIVLLAIALCSFVSAGGQAPASNIKVYFPLLGGCIKAALKHLDAARVSVLVQACSFTSAPIAKAPSDARKHGVNVQVILDKSQRAKKCSSATFQQNPGPLGNSG